MKSDTDIRDDIYEYLKESELAAEVTGTLSKTKRPLNSRKEDIVISVRANAPTQRQEATVYVNVYVQDEKIDGQYEEATARTRTLAELSFRALTIVYGKTFYCHLDEQRIEEAADGNEHVITNKLTYQIINEGK